MSRNTVLALDLSDLQKPYGGKATEYLARVRDGSTGKVGCVRCLRPRGLIATALCRCMVSCIHKSLRIFRARIPICSNECACPAGRKCSCGLFEHVCEKAQRFYEIASFFRYAVADGIHRLLFGSPTGPRREARAQSESGRQLMPFAFLDGCGAWGNSCWGSHLR